MHTWCLINQLISVLLFCLIKNNESLSVCSVGVRIYLHGRRQHHPPYVSIVFQSWRILGMSHRCVPVLLSIYDRFYFTLFLFFYIYVHVFHLARLYMLLSIFIPSCFRWVSGVRLEIFVMHAGDIVCWYWVAQSFGNDAGDFRIMHCLLGCKYDLGLNEV